MQRFLQLFFLLFLSLFLFNSTVSAEEKLVISKSTLYVLEGKIANKYPITIYLTIDKGRNKVDLKYYYNNIHEFIYFEESNIDNNSKYSFKQSEGSEIITATIDKDMVLKGKWSNSKKSFTIVAKPNIDNKVHKLNITTYLLSKENLDFSTKLIQIENPKKISGIDKMNERFKTVYNCNIKKSTTNEELIYYIAGYHLASVDNNYISFIYDERVFDEYSGAYGSSYTDGTIYSLESGKELNNINDLIISKDDPKLVALLQKKLIDKFDGDRRIFGIDFEKVRLTNSYYIDSTGITFIYYQQEIAPYVAGTIKVKFNYKELKPFVKKTSKLWHLFN